MVIALLLTTTLLAMLFQPIIMLEPPPPPPSSDYIWTGTKHFGEIDAIVYVSSMGSFLPWAGQNTSYKHYFLDIIVGGYFPNITGEGEYTCYWYVTRKSNKSYPLDSHLEIWFNSMPIWFDRLYDSENGTLKLIMDFYETFQRLPIYPEMGRLFYPEIPIYPEKTGEWDLIAKVYYENITDVPVGSWDVWMQNVTLTTDLKPMLIGEDVAKMPWTPRVHQKNLGLALFTMIAVPTIIILFFAFRKRFIRKAETQNQPK